MIKLHPQVTSDGVSVAKSWNLLFGAPLRRQIGALAYDDRIDNTGWRRLSEGKDYAHADISEDTLKRYLLPLCAISEFPRNPNHVMHDANTSQLAEALGRSVGGGKLIKE